jgi:hypothetical protein
MPGKDRSMGRFLAILAVSMLLGAGSANAPFDFALIHSREAHQLRALAATHNVAGIEAMKPRVTRTHSSALYGLYFVALYLADTKHHEADFIANYPWQQNQEVSIIFEGKPWGVVPVVDALGDIAVRDGNSRAIQLLFLALNHSDGAAGEGFSDYITAVATKWPRRTLSALRSLPVDERDRALSSDGCVHRPAMLALRARDALDRSLLARIRRIDPRNCP